MRGIIASTEMKRQAKDHPLYVMQDRRTWVRVGRILSGAMVVLVLGVYFYDVSRVETFFDVDAMQPLSISLGFAFFAFVPYSSSRWVMKEDGVFVYNSNKFIPWTQLITAGVQKKRKNTYITLDIKKEAGEIFKQTYCVLMVKEEDAERLCDMIKQFINSIDKMKRIKHIQDEKKVPKKKRTWY